jgi:hypothetical protein
MTAEQYWLRAPTYDELVAARQPYEHIHAIEDPEARIEAAEAALLALVPETHRLAAEHLIGTIAESGKTMGEAFMLDELRGVARHFGGLEHAIMAVQQHVASTSSGRDACSCPVGKAPAGEGPPDGGAA